MAGKARFSLFTGIGGQGWKDAAERISAELGVPIAAYSIGFRQDYEDRYLDWAKVRDIEESGCVLVRPDYFVAWRSQRWEQDGVEKLRTQELDVGLGEGTEMGRSVPRLARHWEARVGRSAK